MMTLIKSFTITCGIILILLGIFVSCQPTPLRKDFAFYYKSCVTTMEAHGIFDSEDAITVANLKVHCVSLANIKTCTMGDCEL